MNTRAIDALQLSSKRTLLVCLLALQFFSPCLVGEAWAMSMSIRRHAFRDEARFGSGSPPVAWRTLAGCPGVWGTNDGPGVAARFSGLVGIVTDSAGNAYVSDSDNHTIRKITPAGIVNTLAGQPGRSGWQDGAANNALFSRPRALAMDADGNLYVRDVENCVIRKISAAGVVTTIAGRPGVGGYADGNGTNALFGYKYNGGLARDTNGNLYVADSGNYVIRKINPAGEVTTLAGQPGKSDFQDGTGTNALFGYDVGGVALDSSGHLYVANSGVIRKITPAGVVTTWVGQQGNWGYRDGKGTNAWFQDLQGLAIDRQDNVYVVDSMARQIRKVSPEGEVSTIGGDPWANNKVLDGYGPFARFSSPSAVALGSSGHLLVVDSSTLRYGTPATEPRPQILRQPCNQTAWVGGNATLQVTAQCGTPLSYQWLANGQVIVGAVNSVLVVQSLSETNAGEYRVAVSDEVGYVLSLPASLQVRPAPGGNPLDNWQRITSLSLREVHGLAYGNSRIVAVGGGYDPVNGYESPWWTPPESQGSLATSTDGEHWVKQLPLTSESLNSVAFGNGTFVVVGNNGTVFTSTNGLAWTAQTLTAEGLLSLHGIAFGQKLFVAVSGDANGSIWTSPDGTNWTCRGIEFGISFLSVTVEGGRFIAVGNTIMTSTNGVDWEAANVPTNYVGREVLLGHIASANGILLATAHDYGEGIVAASINGRDWWDATPTNGIRLARVTSGNDLFLAVDMDAGGVSRSLDGIQWSAPELITGGGRSCFQPHLNFQNGIFLATGEQDDLFTSADGRSWVFRQQEHAMPFAPRTIAAAGGRYYAVGDANAGQGIQASTNGSDWSLALATNYKFSGIAYGAGNLVAVGGNGAVYGSDEWIFTSDDGGVSWTDRSRHVSYGNAHPMLSGITYGAGVFVASGSLHSPYPSYNQNAHLLVSSNGASWTAVDFAGTNWLSDVAYGAGLFVALLNQSSGNSEILTSTNGVSWQIAARIPTDSLYTVAHGNRRFVIGTSDGTGTVITSSDGKAWSLQSVPGVDSFYDIVFGNGIFLARDSSSALWSSPDGITWTRCATPAASNFQTIAVGDGVFFAVGEDAVLYQSGPIERLGNPRWLSNAELEWTVAGAPRINYRIEFSEDLWNWRPLMHVTNAPATAPFVDPDAAGRPSRFYRVVTE